MSMIIARMPNSALNKTQTQIVASELQRIAEECGHLKPALIVEAAKPKSSPIHQFFTWDDSDAARRWREEEARTLIRSIRIVRPDIPESEQPIVRRYINVSANDTETRFDGHAYLPIEEVMRVEDYKQQALNAAMDELRQWRNKHDGLKEFFGVYAEMETVDRSIKARSKAKRPTPPGNLR